MNKILYWLPLVPGFGFLFTIFSIFSPSKFKQSCLVDKPELTWWPSILIQVFTLLWIFFKLLNWI